MTTDFRAVDPSDGRLRQEYPESTPAEVEAALAASSTAFSRWSAVPIAERADVLRRVAVRLRARASTDAVRMADEMGKPVAQGKAESEKCAYACEHAANQAEAWLAAEPIGTEATRSYVRHDALGPVLAIMPWNFPFWQVFRCGASALMAGNPLVLKHAPNVPGCADAIGEIFAEAGLPDGVFANLRVGVDRIEALVADPRIAGVTLTGSTKAGLSVAAVCAKSLKKSVLELGGSDPFLVLADADLDHAADVAARARLQNNGQSCIAAKRFVVDRKVASGFVDRLTAKMAAAQQGDPRDAATGLGPIAREDLRDGLHAQVAASVARGARALIGGSSPARDGWWYPATVLVDVAPGMPAWDEETFGPVAAVRAVDGVDEAVAAANAGPYGLGAAVFSQDLAAAEAVAGRLRCGAVFVNDLVRSDPRMPIGGEKLSGWGRELGREGMREFTTTKSVWVTRL